MRPLNRRSLLFVILTLTASVALAQGKPGSTNPNAPLANPQPQVVDRNGKVVGPRSVTGTVIYTLSDGRKVTLPWNRERLGGFSPIVVFRLPNCAGPAYVTAASGSSQHLGVVLEFPNQGGAIPQPTDGMDLTPASVIRRLYVSDPSARLRLWETAAFQSHLNYALAPFGDICAPGVPPQMMNTPYIPAYVVYDTGIDLEQEFEYPFHLVE